MNIFEVETKENIAEYLKNDLMFYVDYFNIEQKDRKRFFDLIIDRCDMFYGVGKLRGLQK